jgi:predicted glycosyltransferase
MVLIASLTQRRKGTKEQGIFYREIMEFTEIIFQKKLHVLHALPVKKLRVFIPLRLCVNEAHILKIPVSL